jgi:hypothetical protein
LTAFGFNFGEYDEHIIDAINKAVHAPSKEPKFGRSIYIGVYSEADAKHILSIKEKFHAKVTLFDAKTVCWGG